MWTPRGAGDAAHKMWSHSLVVPALTLAGGAGRVGFSGERVNQKILGNDLIPASFEIFVRCRRGLVSAWRSEVWEDDRVCVIRWQCKLQPQRSNYRDSSWSPLFLQLPYCIFERNEPFSSHGASSVAQSNSEKHEPVSPGPAKSQRHFSSMSGVPALHPVTTPN